jgi:hypothetical protein
MKKIIEVVLAWGIFLGSSLTLYTMDKNVEFIVPVKVLKTDLDKARNVCNNIKNQADLVLGYVKVYDAKGLHKTLPCNDILPEGN